MAYLTHLLTILEYPIVIGVVIYVVVDIFASFKDRKEKKDFFNSKK